MFNFALDAKMVDWTNDTPYGQPMPLLAIDIDLNVSEEQKKYKLGLGLYGSVRDYSKVSEGFAKEVFFNPATCPLNMIGRKTAEVYGTLLYGMETVEQFVNYQKESIGNFQQLVDAGIITPSSLIVPANGYGFTSTELRIDIYDENDNLIREYGQRFYLNALPE